MPSMIKSMRRKPNKARKKEDKLKIIQFKKKEIDNPKHFDNLEDLLKDISENDLGCEEKVKFIYSGNNEFPFDAREQWTDSCNLLALKDAAISGMGITQLPLWMVDSDMTSGALRLVLENYRLPAFGIQAVFPSARRIPARTKLFVDFMQDELSSVPYFRGVRASAKSG